MSYYLGLLSTTLGRREEANAYFAQAAQTHERIGAAWALAMTQLSWGRFLVAGGQVAQRQTGSFLLRRALDSARVRGYGLVEHRAIHALETLGIPGSLRPGDPTGWGTVTPRP